MSTKCIPLRPNHWVDSSLPPRLETTVLKGLIIHWYDPQVEGNMICPTWISFAEATLYLGVSTYQMDNFIPMTPSKLRGLRVKSIPTIDGPPFESDESFVLTLACQDAQGPQCTLMLSRFIFQILEFVKPAPPQKKCFRTQIWPAGPSALTEILRKRRSFGRNGPTATMTRWKNSPLHLLIFLDTTIKA